MKIALALLIFIGVVSVARADEPSSGTVLGAHPATAVKTPAEAPKTPAADDPQSLKDQIDQLKSALQVTQAETAMYKSYFEGDENRIRLLQVQIMKMQPKAPQPAKK